MMETVCGTHHYLAPELVRCDRGEISSYDRSVDVWGIGLIAFIMLFGFNPFARDSQRETHNAIVRCDWKFPEGYTVSDFAVHFVASLLRGQVMPNMAGDA